MILAGDTISFNSWPHYFEKEIKGTKPNTVRSMDPNLDLSEVKYIRIQNGSKNESFTRDISDISRVGEIFGKGIVVFSWVHPTPEVIKGNLETALLRCCSKRLLKHAGFI